MAGAPETAAILDSLNSQRADARERQAAMERQIREEARRLREGLTGAVLFCALPCYAVPCCACCALMYFLPLLSPQRKTRICCIAVALLMHHHNC